jgi:hypothetical protein
MRFLLVGFALLTLMSSAALAGPNASTTLVLHAVDTTFGPCPIPPPSGPDPCDQGTLRVDLAVGGPGIAAYLLIRNYDNISGVQCAFDWPAAWPVTFGLWDCQSNQVNGQTPSAPGGTTGTIATAFDNISGGVTAPIGRIHFAGIFAAGCMSIIESDFPFGTHVISFAGDVDPVIEANRGALCAGSPGTDACTPVIPVEPATWGHIKAQYQR